MHDFCEDVYMLKMSNIISVIFLNYLLFIFHYFSK